MRMSNLVAEKGREEDGFVDIVVHWSNEDPWTDFFQRIETRSSNGDLIKEGRTQGLNFTLNRKEFWTKYEIILFDSGRKIAIDFDTGPGGESFSIKSRGGSHERRDFPPHRALN